MNPVAVLGAAVIGLSLGLTGAGGSILTLPVLVYLAGVPPTEAVGLSLFIVGVAASAGAIQRFRSGDFHVRAAMLFGIAGALGAALGARFTSMVSAELLMGSFAVLMVVVAVRMLRPGNDGPEPAPDCQPLRCLLAGAGTGILTGFVGVGGGFLLMPALMRFARLPIGMATGTSLAVIAINSAVGWLAHLPTSIQRPELMAVFGGLAAGGTLLGKLLAAKLPARRLRQGFGAMVLVIGGIILWRSIAD